MIKQGILYLILSIILVLSAHYAHQIIVYIAFCNTYFNTQLAPFFSASTLGVMARQIIVLLALPLMLAAAPALIYRGIKGHAMPFFVETTWILWLIIVLSSILTS